jgi:hypothetical protein
VVRINALEGHQSTPPDRLGDHLDVAIAGLSARQDLTFSRGQLLALGATRKAIQHRLATKRLYRVHTSVYALVPPTLLTLRGRYLAAVLACGDTAVLSHRAAGALAGIRSIPAGAIDVTVPWPRRVRHAGIRVHVTRSLRAEDITAIDGIPCTSWARTILDLAGVDPPRLVARALEQSLILRVFDRASLDALLATANGRRGAGVVRRLLEDLPDGIAPTRSELERAFLALIEAAGLPPPVVNDRIAGYEVDFHWPAHRVIVETDGRRTHDTPLAFERDRQRDLDLELAGWRVVRITWRQVTREPARVAALLSALLRVTTRDVVAGAELAGRLAATPAGEAAGPAAPSRRRRR